MRRPTHSDEMHLTRSAMASGPPPDLGVITAGAHWRSHVKLPALFFILAVFANCTAPRLDRTPLNESPATSPAPQSERERFELKRICMEAGRQRATEEAREWRDVPNGASLPPRYC